MRSCWKCDCPSRQTTIEQVSIFDMHVISTELWFICGLTIQSAWVSQSQVFTQSEKKNQTLMKMILLLGIFKRCVETKGKISLLWIWSDRVSFLIDRFRALIKFQTNEIDHSKMVVISIDKRNAKPVTKVAFNRSGCDLICCCKRNKTPTEDRAFFHAFLVFFLYFSPRFTLNFVCGSG